MIAVGSYCGICEIQEVIYNFTLLLSSCIKAQSSIKPFKLLRHFIVCLKFYATKVYITPIMTRNVKLALCTVRMCKVGKSGNPFLIYIMLLHFILPQFRHCEAAGLFTSTLVPMQLLHIY